ncbi:DNA-binding transcriptional regulator, FrmR family [Atopostipes suicloacalis DSM 15692]|uniref:DNA-binding transcriptional regulator, FrmR family n=1 Tax=Atopostipes suicloacalis DSM 15692 TaxID=1121025 RepID=A0A1M4S7H1_9LACT|nr:metal-sensitive transcriptional regulator [Atopostipes suicloacalis]SHE28159.1 DNA-binding transcriptional regulator, FrmR family [Atopostipes suicloacalis DSM 15692]
MSSLYEKNVKNRLKRSEGQIRGVLNMMEEEKDCKDVVTQLSAIRTSIDRAIGLIVAENLAQCLREESDEENSESIQEAINLIVRTR